MRDKTRKTTRREFFEAGASAVARATIALTAAEAALGAAPGRRSYRIFSEGRIGNLRLSNRLIRSATAEGASPGGRISKDGLRIYERLAEGGVGLIITGHMVAARGGDAHENQTHIDDAQYVGALRTIADTVHRRGARCKVVAQVSHAGPRSIIDPVAPAAGVLKPDGKEARVLSAGEIEDLTAQFAASVGRAKEAGFDGVEIHSAHGYLLGTFLSPATNKRDDEYGGSPARRASVIGKIVAAARRTVGPAYPILIKVDCNDQGNDEAAMASFVEVLREIEKSGVSAIDISGKNAARTEIDSPDKESYFLPQAERADVKVPLILTGGNRSVDRMEGILERGKVHLLALARPLIREPDLPKRWLEGRGEPAAACISCNGCLKGLGTAPTHCVRVLG